MFRKMLAVMLVAGIAAVGTMLAPPPSVAAQASPSATRSFSPQGVEPGGQVVVTINAANYGVGGAVTETLPAGFTYVSSSSTLPDDQTGVTGQEVRFTLVGDTSFTYTVTASSVGGSYTFSGTLRDSDRNDHAVGGDTTVTVSSREPLVARYDDNNNGTIERIEVIAAINDYLFGEGDDAITRSDVIKLINLYLFAPAAAQPPGAPTGLTATANGPTQIDLSWSGPSDDGGAAITGYRIEVSADRSAWSDLVGDSGSTSTTHSHTGLTAGTTRHYRVSAINSAGTGPASNIATGTTASPPAGSPATDRATLVALYNAMDGPNWPNSANWLTAAPLDEWFGVTTDGSTGRVIDLTLIDNNLKGQLPPELGDLTALEGLDLGGNFIYDYNLPALSDLPSLRRLSLFRNFISDVSALSSLTLLELLDLYDNGVSDVSPLLNLPSLRFLNVWANPLTGRSIDERIPVLQARGVEVAYADIAFTGGGFTVEDGPQAYNDNLFILPVEPGEYTRDYAASFYRYFEDEFDFLMFITTDRLVLDTKAAGWFIHVMNDVQGIGVNVFSDTHEFGSAGRLQGVMFFSALQEFRSVGLHELMHRWAAFVLPSEVSIGSHWRTPSDIFGILDGNCDVPFDEIVELGEDRYLLPECSFPREYSPLELYLAGFIPPEEVPEFWVAQDAQWIEQLRSEHGLWDRVFTASEIKRYTIDDVIAAHGRRVPEAPQAQREFRAAAILLIDENHPASMDVLNVLSRDVALFSHAGMVEDGPDIFYEGTGGRARIVMDGLSQFLKDSATVPGAPTDLTATANGLLEINLSWTAPPETGGADITGYRIEVSEDRTGWSDLESDTGSTATTYSHTGLKAGSTWHYRVSAINSAGTGPASSVATALPPSSDATLSALTVSPVDIAGFSSGVTEYDVGVAHEVTQVSITLRVADSRATIDINGSAVASGSGHAVSLSEGLNVVTITVTAQDGSTTKVYTVSIARGSNSAFAWKVTDDFNYLGMDSAVYPRGIWSNGHIMWVACATDNDNVGANLCSYDMSTKERGSNFHTLGTWGNNSPTGITSDGTTMWVADSRDKKIYAYRMASYARNPAREINGLAAAGIDDPTGIAVDPVLGGFWIADWDDGKLYAYNRHTLRRIPGADFNTLAAAGNTRPLAIWTDGTTMWVANFVGSKIYAYDRSTKARDPSRDFNTLRAAGNTWPMGIWSDGETMLVSDRFKRKIFSYNMPDPTDATLSGLTVSPVDIVAFSSDVTAYHAGVANDVTQATVTATAADPGATIEINGSAVSSGSSHGVSLVEGRNNISIMVTAGDGRTTKAYTVTVGRSVTIAYGWNAAEDFNTLNAAGNEYPTGIWSDGTTVWVADLQDDKIYAYSLGTRARFLSKDIDVLAAGNTSPSGLWSDGTTLWVSDPDADKLYAYSLSNGARDASRDLDGLKAAGNEYPAGIWSDGTTMWVMDVQDEKIYAYDLATKVRDEGKEFNALSIVIGTLRGIWSDGKTMWVVADKGVHQTRTDKIYAYDMVTKARDAAKDSNGLTSVGNEEPWGIWSDGATIWVANYEFRASNNAGESIRYYSSKIYAYNMPATSEPTPTPDATLSKLTVSPVDVAGFSSDVTEYHVGVGNSVTLASVTATASDADATIEINGSVVSSGTPHSVSLAEGAQRSYDHCHRKRPPDN